MIILEFKAYGKNSQYSAINEAIRTVKFVRNSCLRLWIDNKGITKYDLNKYCRVLAKNFSFANELNSTARQAAAERAWSSIGRRPRYANARFYETARRKYLERKGSPDSRSIVDRSNTSSQDGKYPLTKSRSRSVGFAESRSLTRKELGSSNSKVSGTYGVSIRNKSSELG
ncbi:putative transposase [Moorena producens 3L]|uniref:Putative transposase n=1 Tax=Moorena producens 3L TaxID=489825 RepID=F4XMY6_9CYAN|nr:putative transposase [Moorena producens 3L]